MHFQAAAIPTETTALYSVHFAQDKFVAVGNDGILLQSSDGIDWKKRLSNTSKHLYDIVYGGGTWVAVGDEGNVITSADASAFSLRNSGSGIPLHSLAFGNDAFVAVGDSGAILRSPDGANWTLHASEEALDLKAVAFGNNRFIAVGTNGVVHSSVDGNEWATTFIPDAPGLLSVDYADGYFLALRVPVAPFPVTSGTGEGYLSRDGISWNPISFGLDRYRAAVSADGNLFILGNTAIISKAIFPESGISLQHGLNNQGEFTLSFQSPEQGTFTILSTLDIEAASWEETATLNNVSAGEWTDTRAPAGRRFYRVVRE